MKVLPGRWLSALFVSSAVFAALVAAPAANAQPPKFPDVDSYPAADLAEYQVIGAHPSMSGWVFSTPSGLRCQSNMIADLGVSCTGPIVGAGVGMNSVVVSLTKPGLIAQYEQSPDDHTYPLLPTGSKIAPGNGTVCAVLADDALACRAKKPDSWPADTQDPPDRHYGEHGFVVQPSSSWVY
ncbi:hypothetical protein CCUG63695_01132 [Mycobacteroides franklinii]|uniref:Secreted protein n=1 Tax=Mycobacteroides franklinii TaxID=948102 RepID=A0A4R8R427_9MYCO|nr:hypothetical protein CCUG64054_00133 [Mycobacteroides franklinii]TDZ47827.1 hypothetical protein CCUG63697_04117 [Mycobacteroides franklinii]TDZ60035.1 hypothetical protein CCUG63696_00135 [Mycobacteroides franklinii]TDZ65434.1 hypothetical protein CCUG63695_01132 [Mycobacteroides franklinii]TDZ73604.1 hypothetical protein CCUG64056_00133 [Mycobacteroides franklinii]